MSKFRLGRLDVEVSGARAVLAGRIDDTSQLDEIVNQLPPGDVVIHTAGVSFMNSIGTREWMRLIRRLRTRGTITLEAVSEVLMVQMNMFSAFGNSVQIVSFHAGYMCPTCGCEASLLVDAAAYAEAQQPQGLPMPRCPECQSAMELSDFPERYLSIFRGSGQPTK
jgi:DNA-directed RNA polymerase subunit RPC12/RpoP